MKFSIYVISSLLAGSLLFPATAISADLCENLKGQILIIDGNGYEGKTGPYWGLNMKKEQDGSFSFTTTLRMAGEQADSVVGKCKDRHIVFTRKREGVFEQVYDGWIFEKGGRKMAGTFSHNGSREYGWCGSIRPPLPR